MKRREFLFGLVAGVAVGTPALAEGAADSIVRQLKRLGFREIVQERTLLGRVRITAHRKDGDREIIVNPNTGEILRDLWTPTGGSAGDLAIIDDHRGKSGKDGKNDDEDEEDNDRSGHGSGNSGSSGSGSGSGGSGGGGDDDED